METKLKSFFKEYKNILAAYNMAHSTMYFDMVTIAPKKGIPARSEMMSILSGEAFDYQMREEHLKKLDELYAITQDEELKKELDMYFKTLESQRNLPKEVYVRFVKTISDAEEAWAEAKAANDYQIFKDHLVAVIKGQKEVLSYVDKNVSDYDYMLDQYQKGMNRERYDIFFNKIKEELLPFIQRIIKEGKVIDGSPLDKTFDVEGQKAFMKEVMDFLKVDAGKTYLGESAHPFTIFFSANESRMTTHYYEKLIKSAILSTIHEYGHALYSLQVDSKYDNTIFKDGIGMAMHESQSRFLENYIGRSKAFWEVLYPRLQKQFPEQLENVSMEQFYEMLHIAQPSFIRTEADELTYPIHILIRYELEKEIFDGTVDYDNLDKMWNDKYEEYLGIRPDKDSQGILQDMHWSAANLGYFPTYALGSAYAAQFYNAITKQLDVETLLREDKFEVIRDWLKDNIHCHGAYLDADEILLKATGETFNPDYYINYLKEKYGSVYELK